MDAEQLVLHILNPGLVRHSGTLLRPPSLVAVMPPLTQAGRIDCANLPCYTKGGVRTQGSKSCIEFKCKPCCSNAALQAFTNGIGRPRCNAHSQAAVVEQQVEVFTLPHVIHMDSTGLHWTPLDSSGFQCPICQAKLAGTMPSPLESSPVQSSLVHWTPTGLQTTFQSPVTVQWTESPVKVQWSPVESTGFHWIIACSSYCY